MASEDSDSEDRMEASHGPRECMACRGSGQVISSLGGTANPVSCPWCEGTGERRLEVDAQARWPVEQTPADPPPDPGPHSAA